MSKLSCVLFVLVTVCLVKSVVGVEEGSKVAVLTADSFQAHVDTHDMTLVEFYAPWCGHCKALAPEYDRASIMLEGKDGGSLAKVDCTEEKSLCNDYGVRGFPTLKLFRQGVKEPSDYDGPRKADGIVKWMIKQKAPAITVIDSAEKADSFAKDDAVKIIGFFGASDDKTAFEATANMLRNEYAFGSVTGHSALNTKYGVKSTPSVVLFRNFDEPRVEWPGTGSISTWVKAEAFPVVGEIGPENYAKYVERGLNFVWIFISMEDAAQGSLITDDILPVAKENRDKLSFVKLDGVRWAEHAKSFGLSGKTPSIAIEDREKGKNFLFPEDKTVNKAEFGQFIADYLGGKLTPNLKSEPIPATNDGPVKVVVGKTFDTIVMDDSKDVLVEFYAPWCGHCKSLAPIYDELGKKFKDDQKVVIAKVDATANDTPAQVQGFPTLIFYPAGKKSHPIEYDGDRTVKAMSSFIKSGGASSHDDL